MNMVLAKRRDEWFLAAFAPHIKGCNLSTNRKPLHKRDQFHHWRGNVFVQSHAPLDDIVFYPELLYHGYRVYPEWWDSDRHEPLIHCVTGSDSWRRPIRTEADLHEMIAELKADGWEYNPKDQDARRYIHVDELEKVEGPPPGQAL